MASRTLPSEEILIDGDDDDDDNSIMDTKRLKKEDRLLFSSDSVNVLIFCWMKLNMFEKLPGGEEKFVVPYPFDLSLPYLAIPHVTALSR